MRTMSEKDEGYEIVDKRRKYDEATQEQAAEPSAAAQPEAEQAAQPEADPEAVSSEQASADSAGAGPQEQARVEDMLVYILNILGAAAWQWMGLLANPATGEAEQDLDQARLAIDSFDAIAEKLMPRLAEGDQGHIRQILADLRANFVQKSAKGSGS